MARISKNALTEDEKRVLVKQYTRLLSDKKSSKQEQLLSEILTETEQLIVLKRVAAVILIDQKQSTYEIARTLKLSSASVSHYKAQIAAGKFSTLLELVRGKTFDTEAFWRTIDKVLRLGLPPIAGPGRWSTIAPAAVRGARKR